MRLLTDRLLAGQRCLQGRARGGQFWTGAGLEHGGDVEGLEAETQKHRQEALADHTRRQSPRCLLTQRGIRVRKTRVKAYCLSKPGIREKQIL